MRVDNTSVKITNFGFASRINGATQTICTFFLGLALAILFANTTHASPPTKTLIMLNWADYMDPGLLTKFEEIHNVKVKEVYFETDDERDSILLSNDQLKVDIIIVNGAMIDIYRKRGWIAPINESLIPNIKHLDPHWRIAFAGAETHAIPYFWGTMGIAYRKDLVKTQITHWRQLFNPSPELQGKIVMIDTTRDVIGMALKALGFSANSSNRDQLKQAEALLTQQKPSVLEYSYIATDETSSLLTGEVVAAMIYNGDALTVQEYSEDIEFLVPAEGGNIWVDYLAVSSSSKSKDEAYKFLNFLHEPENAAKLAEQVYFATPNQEAEKLLPEDFLENQTIYPPAKVLKNSEFYDTLPPRTLSLQNSIYSRIAH